MSVPLARFSWIGLAFELQRRAGDGVDPGVVGEADDADAVVGRLVFLVRGVREYISRARRRSESPGESRELVDRLADVADDDDFEILMLPLPARPAEDQDEAKHHREAGADRHPFPHRPEPRQRPEAQ